MDDTDLFSPETITVRADWFQIFRDCSIIVSIVDNRKNSRLSGTATLWSIQSRRANVKSTASHNAARKSSD